MKTDNIFHLLQQLPDLAAFLVESLLNTAKYPWC